MMVYPRPRGEYGSHTFAPHIGRGLPPPTRGILHAIVDMPVREGSTPAHAGNTIAARFAQPPLEVYPRPRGEYRITTHPTSANCGLPPPTRGIQVAHRLADSGCGSTPAHAGNTDRMALPTARTWVYPRPRGEYFRYARSPSIVFGLPPPTRGIHISILPLRVRLRSTPAHAGNTSKSPVSVMTTTVYPRPRGEYQRRIPDALSRGGLPPPTRGIQVKRAHEGLPPRSTPAHAGNTNRNHRGG